MTQQRYPAAGQKSIQTDSLSHETKNNKAKKDKSKILGAKRPLKYGKSDQD
jgi:hypothetical protein